MKRTTYLLALLHNYYHVISFTLELPTATQISRDVFNERLVQLSMSTSLRPETTPASRLPINNNNYNNNNNNDNRFNNKGPKKKLKSPPVPITSLVQKNDNKILYASINVPFPDYNDVSVPVAVWYPFSATSEFIRKKPAFYKHKISLRKIGKLIAGWNSIPSFASKRYNMKPTFNTKDKTRVFEAVKSFPIYGPVVVLAHGYLGSRFDMSHIAEYLALNGFMVISPEYPESLSDSYKAPQSLNRSFITYNVLSYFQNTLKLSFTSVGIIGHSLGCRTAVSTGDPRWPRVCIAGYPGESQQTMGASVLAISSINDGAVGYERLMENIMTGNFYNLEEDDIYTNRVRLERRTSLFFDERDNAPNHISFLSENVNNCMIDYLSPVLPVAQALKLPVLDFDKYKKSRDSELTAVRTLPVILEFLKRNMLQQRAVMKL